MFAWMRIFRWISRHASKIEISNERIGRKLKYHLISKRHRSCLKQLGHSYQTQMAARGRKKDEQYFKYHDSN